MSQLVFAAPMLERLREDLLAEAELETCAVAFTRAGGDRLLVSSYELAPEVAYAARTGVSAELTPEYLLDVANRARREKLGCVFVHSHPMDEKRPSFSYVDDRGEGRLTAFFDARVPGQHCALVVSPGGVRARRLGAGAEIDVVEVGRKLHVASGQSAETAEEERFDRQVRAFGAEGQRRIAELTIAIVGLGGTGSVTCQQLALLGVSKFLLFDFDQIERTNLNRVVGAQAADVGDYKVDVAERLISQLNPAAAIRKIVGDVVDDGVARQLLTADVIFLCTDSHASRAIVGQLAYQYLIPTIDMGVSLSVRGGVLSYITGRTQLLAPGLPCLTCLDLLDSETIRRELLTPEARAADPYITGVHEPQPAVISLNSTMASLAVTMFLGLVTDASVAARYQIYDGMNGTVKNFTGAIDPTCYVCSSTGALARGDSWPLPTRKG